MLVNVPYQVKHTEIGKAEIILAINAGKARDILSEGDQISLVLEEGSAKERKKAAQRKGACLSAWQRSKRMASTV